MDNRNESLRRNRSSSNIADTSSQLQHELQIQETIPADEIIDSLASNDTNQANYNIDDDIDQDNDQIEEMGMSSDHQPSLEQIQRVYYTRGLEELESLQLLDLSPLANWKLSSFKQGCGLTQLRDDSPDTLWQSDGSNGNQNSSNNGLNNNQLSNPHSVTIQFSKKVSLERISIFTNFSLDESYTPSKIKIMAGSSGWDLTEVCTVNFNKPIGWSHIIFNGIRSDGVLKCFIVKLIILANHQDGKDSHIRAIRCFGKKSLKQPNITNSNSILPNNTTEIDASMLSGLTNQSGILLNHRDKVPELDDDSNKILGNVDDIIGFNSGFQSIELKSVSSIR